MNDNLPLGLPPEPQENEQTFELPLEFEAFYLSRQEFYHDYATELLGDRGEAEELIHEVFGKILASWEDLLGSGDFEADVWEILRDTTVRRLRGHRRRPAFIAKGAFTLAMDATRHRLSALEEGMGLYSAIADLPPQQFDVIVLRYLLGYDTRKIAWFLGLDKNTVNYHGGKGKKRLGRQLGIPETPRRRPRKENP
ncbi:sigma-70 family RNA polymerase sigma factor [Streptomyces luteireticuli]|uniref:RNA polymerase sigma factor 70 region 4 type 2 domain-containing protein n=1 Tax=Streptomyces luteireticuli TaxID=173858 RepID=A0ABN0YXZ5_9ACTN